MCVKCTWNRYSEEIGTKNPENSFRRSNLHIQLIILVSFHPSLFGVILDCHKKKKSTILSPPAWPHTQTHSMSHCPSSPNTIHSLCKLNHPLSSVKNPVLNQLCASPGANSFWSLITDFSTGETLLIFSLMKWPYGSHSPKFSA